MAGGPCLSPVGVHSPPHRRPAPLRDTFVHVLGGPTSHPLLFGWPSPTVSSMLAGVAVLGLRGGGALPSQQRAPAAGEGSVTSLISLILEPPLPIRDPHWLAGTTSLSVTGGLLVAGLLLIELMISWGGRKTRVGLHSMPHTRQ